jgi:hypothetical protein
MRTKELTKMQCRHVARLMAVMVVREAAGEGFRDRFAGISEARDGGQLSATELTEIQDQMDDIGLDLLGKDLQFNNFAEILNFVRKG